ncbi:hypothetical protein Hanom_Chr07g00659811 [Helianthus anomalus]
MVSAYCGLVSGQIGNINLTDEDYQPMFSELDRRSTRSPYRVKGRTGSTGFKTGMSMFV